MALFKSKRKKNQELYASGSKGVGTVLLVEDKEGASSRPDMRVNLTFRVEPLDGGPAFDLTKKRRIPRVELPRQGDRYPVWYDPQDLDAWAFATVVDDNGRAAMRQQFGDVAETFVGMGVPAAPASQGQDTAEALTQLADLHRQGLLTDDEFRAQKAKLLG